MTGTRVVLLTGPVGAGKTTMAARVVDEARRQGLACSGLLAPAVHDDGGHKTGILGIDLSSDTCRTLARTDRTMGGPRLGPYSFDAEALQWATEVVLRALGCTDSIASASEEEAKPRPDGAEAKEAAGGSQDAPDGGQAALVVVDEIGKLELEHGQGLAPVLPALTGRQAGWVLVIVRDSLLAELQQRMCGVEQVVFRANPGNRDALPALILERILAW